MMLKGYRVPSISREERLKQLKQQLADMNGRFVYVDEKWVRWLQEINLEIKYINDEIAEIYKHLDNK